MSLHRSERWYSHKPSGTDKRSAGTDINHISRGINGGGFGELPLGVRANARFSDDFEEELGVPPNKLARR